MSSHQVSPRIRAEFIHNGAGPIRYTHVMNGQAVSETDALAMIARDHHISIAQAREVVKRELTVLLKRELTVLVKRKGRQREEL